MHEHELLLSGACRTPSSSRFTHHCRAWQAYKKQLLGGRAAQQHRGPSQIPTEVQLAPDLCMARQTLPCASFPVRDHAVALQVGVPERTFGTQLVEDSEWERPEVLPFSTYAACRILDTTPDSPVRYTRTG